jgi:hypothetical protein
VGYTAATTNHPCLRPLGQTVKGKDTEADAEPPLLEALDALLQVGRKVGRAR